MTSLKSCICYCNFSSNNSKNTNLRHNSLARTDHWNSKLSTNIQCEKKNHSAFLIFQNLQRNQQKNYISDIFWTFKSKLQIIHAVTYIHCFFLTLINVFLYVQYHTCISVSTIFSFCVLIFTFFVLLVSPRDAFYNLQCLIRFQYNLPVIRKYLQSTAKEKVSR